MIYDLLSGPRDHTRQSHLSEPSRPCSAMAFPSPTPQQSAVSPRDDSSNSVSTRLLPQRTFSCHLSTRWSPHCVFVVARGVLNCRWLDGCEGKVGGCTFVPARVPSSLRRPAGSAAICPRRRMAASCDRVGWDNGGSRVRVRLCVRVRVRLRVDGIGDVASILLARSMAIMEAEQPIPDKL